MSETTKIEWCDSTFNPWMGCTKISPACDHCYAEALMDTRHHRVKWGGSRVRTSTWHEPKRWQRQAEAFFAEHGRRRRVFCASLADVFDNQVPTEWRDDLWALIRETPDLDWLLLTKRPQNIGKMLPAYWGEVKGHVWLGTTVEDQARADQNIPHLLEHDAAVRFVSVEPMLGPVDLTKLVRPMKVGGHVFDALACDVDPGDDEWEGRSINWVIAGGESGSQARPSHPDWFRSLRDQCAAAGVPFLFKQWGEWSPRGPESFGYPVVDGVPQFRMSDTGDNGSDLAATGGNHSWLNCAGKKRAGRLLDGVEHNGFPEARA